MLFEAMEFTPELVIRGYLQGLHPSPHSIKGTLRFYDPDPRALVPIEEFHVPKELARIIRQERFDIRVDTDYPGVIAACADRPTTWIRPYIIDAYLELHRLGVAHSVEAWQDGQLVGGLMGIALGSYFACESMFFHVSHASKVAFVHLCIMLRTAGFTLHDIMQSTRLHKQFGAFEIPRCEFKRRLTHAIIKPAIFPPTG